MSYDGWLIEGAEGHAQAWDAPELDTDDVFARLVSNATDSELHAMVKYITRELISREQQRLEDVAMLVTLEALPSDAESLPF